MGKESTAMSLDLDQIFQDVRKMLGGKNTIKDTMGLSDNSMEYLYGTAFDFYEAGKYEKSTSIFKLLCYYNNHELKYFKALGSSLQMQGKYLDAITAYSFATIMDHKDPEPPLHAAHCYMKLGDLEKARTGFLCASTYAEESEKPDSIKNYAAKMVDLVDGMKKPDKKSKGL